MRIRLFISCICIAILTSGIGCQKGNNERPLIGITSVYHPATEYVSARVSVDFNYVTAVLENGGTPFILPTIDSDDVVRHYLDELDGLVIVGGADIPPAEYGEAPHETTIVMPLQRYQFEKKLIGGWLATGKPILGVCLGMQLSNVISGGSLIQDIPSQVGDQIAHREIGGVYHEVRIEQGSLLYEILDNDKAQVLSSHHQAVKDLGKNLRVIARSDDGVIEALERIEGGWDLFVQWHPESMRDRTHRDAIYGALIEACQ
jgi:putative glutamine amidotransferase